MKFSPLRTGHVLIAICVLLVSSHAQTSNWIAPLDTATHVWTDASNWDNGVPNGATAVAVFSANPSSRAVIEGTVNVGSVRFNGSTGLPLQVGSGFAAGQLNILGMGLPDSGATLLVAGGQLRLSNQAVTRSTIALPSYLPTPFARSVVFADQSSLQGSAYIGWSTSGTIEFRDSSTIAGGSISCVGSGTIIFRDHSRVVDGTLWFDLPSTSTIRVLDSADLSGLRIPAFLGISSRVRLDISGAAQTVTVASIRGDIDLNLGARTLRVLDDYTHKGKMSLVVQGIAQPSLVVVGTAQLNGALTIDGFPATAWYGSHRYALVSATSLSGSFTQVTGLINTPMLKSRLDYTSSDAAVVIEQQSFATLAAKTPAAVALGGHIDATINSTSVSYGALLTRLNTLSSIADVSATLDALAPTSYGALPVQALAEATARQTELMHQLACRESTVFFIGNTQRTRFDATDGVPQAIGRSSGGTAGAIWHHAAFSLGGFVTQQHSSLELDAIGSKATTRTLTPGLVVQSELGPNFVRAIAAFGRLDYTVQREIRSPGWNGTAVAQPSAQQHELTLLAGRRFRPGAWDVELLAGAAAINWKLDRFAETGTVGAAALEIGTWRHRSRRSVLGASIARMRASDRWQPHLGMQWLHEFASDDPIPSRLAAASGDYYPASGRRPERNLLQLQTGLDYRASKRLVIQAEASCIVAHNSQAAPRASLGCSWQF